MMKLKSIYSSIVNRIHYYKVIHSEMKSLKKINRSHSTKRIFYLGITPHSNLGDMAQHYCICNWLSENYPDYVVCKFEAKTVVDAKTGFIEELSKIITDSDFIVFQSGYTTQDLGGQHELMHRLVIEKMPNVRILMMPQTIYFKSEANRKRCSDNHKKAKNMLFLARDRVSYEQAVNMFEGLKIAAYPDIVTTLIGTLHFNNKRQGLCLCRRNDIEKFYSELELDSLLDRIRENDHVTVCDTSIEEDYITVRNNMKFYIEREIEKFSHYEVTITDRYHGTIFSLIAGTPVIILKTTDHKVITGADWFNGVYDGYVYVASDLDEAYQIYKKVKSQKRDNVLSSYMKEHYYDNLKQLFENIHN